MPDSITVQNQPQDYFSRLINSFKGIGFGLLLFVLSFVVLFNSEGGTDMSKIAEKAVSVEASNLDKAANNGAFLALHGNIVTDGTIGDQVTFSEGQVALVKPGSYLALNRNVEYYAWVEKSESSSSNSSSGSSTTTYNYVKEWVRSIPSSANFHLPAGHENPVAAINDNEVRASAAKIGDISLDVAKLTMPESEKLVLNAEVVELPSSTLTAAPAVNTATTASSTQPATALKSSLVDGNYIYYGNSYSQPALGEVRVSYSVVKSGINATVFGKLDGSSLITYVEGKDTLYRAFNGSKEEALNKMHGEFMFFLWLMRILGFLMMWIGLGSILAPLSAILDFLPVIGGMSRGLISGVTFLVSLVLTVITILVAKVAHNPLIMVAVVVVMLAGVGIWIKGQAKKKDSAVNSVTPPTTTQS